MTELLQDLQSIELFSKLPPEQLKWLVEKSELRGFDVGDIMFNIGDPIDNMGVILEGAFALKFKQGDQFKEFAQSEKGSITGKLPYSRAKVASALAVAIEPARVLIMHERHLPEMIRSQHEMTEALVHTMLTRIRDFTKSQQMNEKLMALGKLSAGLAHELNNPSSAVVRSAGELKKHLALVPEKFKRVISIRLDNSQIDILNRILFSRVQQGIAEGMSLMERSEREEELTDWLDDHEVDNSDGIAETLTDFAFNTDDLEAIREATTDEYLDDAVAWLEDVLTTEKLVQEIQDASKRIADLVKSVKTYTHMDQAPDKQKIDIRKGIESTLVMLNHKARRKNITLQCELPDDLPLINAFPSELNQVWTNLIDNAIDAVDQDGTLTLRARREREFVMIDIIDDGKGIPEEIQSRIFEPFFTTKPQGQGTGLGLDIVQRIIQHHNADIKVESQPGETKFKLCFPME